MAQDSPAIAWATMKCRSQRLALSKMIFWLFARLAMKA